MKSIKAVFFIVTLLSIISFIRFVIYRTVNEVNFGPLGNINQIANHRIDPDIAVFGSSVAWTGINPLIIEESTGKSCYNFAIDGNSMIQYNGLLNEFLNYSDSKYIIIAGTYDEFGKRSKFYELSNYAPYLSNESILNGLKEIDEAFTLKARYVPYYDLTLLDQKFYEYLFVELFNKEIQSNYRNSVKGFVPVSPALNLFSTEDSSSFIISPIDSVVIDLYKNLICEANKKGIKVILVLAPIYSETQQRIINLSDVRETYKTLAADNIFVDLSSVPFCSNKKLFYNGLHVNREGAAIMTKIILQNTFK